jgi:hypothetical protein
MNYLKEQMQSWVWGTVKDSAHAAASSALQYLLAHCGGWYGLIAIAAAIILLIALGRRIFKAVFRLSTVAVAVCAVLAMLYCTGDLGRLAAA